MLNTLIVAAGYFLSRVLGIIRDIIINAQFGTIWQMDAYQAAFQIPDLLYIVIMGGALGSSFIPVFSGFLGGERSDDAWRLANGVLNMALVVMVGIAALVAWQADWCIRLIYHGFSPEKYELAASLLRLLLIQPVLLGIGGLAKATLESFDRFSVPALGSNLYNVGIILGALLFAPFWGVYGLAAGVIVGAVLFLAVQVPALLRLGYRYAPNFDLRTPGLLRIGALMAPRLFGQSAWQVGLIISSGIAGALGDGAVRANAIALQLMMLPHGLLALSLGTVIFPRMARAHSAGDSATLRRESVGAMRSVLFPVLPTAIILGVLAVPVIRLLFERLRFDAASTALTAQALQCYAVGLAAFAVAEIVVRTYYAMQDTLTPVLVGIATVAVNVALAWLFVGWGMGIAGVGLAFSIASIAEAMLLLVILWRRWGTLDGLWQALGTMLLLSAVFGAVLLGLRWLSAPLLPSILLGGAYQWPWGFVPLAAWSALAAALAGACYMGLALLLRLPEAGALLARVRRLVRR